MRFSSWAPAGPRRRLRPALAALAIFAGSGGLAVLAAPADDPVHHTGLLFVLAAACPLMCLYLNLVERAPAAPRLLLTFLPLGAIVGSMFLPWGFAAAQLAAMVVTAELTLFLARRA